MSVARRRSRRRLGSSRVMPGLLSEPIWCRNNPKSAMKTVASLKTSLMHLGCMIETLFCHGFTKDIWKRNLHSVMANVPDCEIIVSKFELQPYYFFHFQINTFWDKCEPSHLAPAMYLSTRMTLALNNTQRLICHSSKKLNQTKDLQWIIINKLKF